jgi:hypothetical protein
MKTNLSNLVLVVKESACRLVKNCLALEFPDPTQSIWRKAGQTLASNLKHSDPIEHGANQTSASNFYKFRIVMMWRRVDLSCTYDFRELRVAPCNTPTTPGLTVVTRVGYLGS